MNNHNNNPCFEGLFPKKLSQTFTLPNNKLKLYSIDEYKNLSNIDKKILRFEYTCATSVFNKDFYKNTEFIHDKVSDCIKKGLDEKYGENNYIVLTIGRSLSSIGKVLSYKIGEDRVLNIPLSNSHRFITKNSITQISDNEIIGLKSYLESIGLSKEKIKKSDKKFIITDYCFSGTSLKGAKQLFTSEKIFGNQKNIFVEDINSLIEPVEESAKISNEFRHYLYESKFKEYSFVGKNINLAHTSASIKDTKKVNKTTKLMWFKLLDNFMRKNQSKTQKLDQTI